jgi:hypothetical protein
LNALELVAENDDMVPDSVFASRVVFNAVAGQTYHIPVDASKTRTPDGAVVLTIRPPTALQQVLAIPRVLAGGTVRLEWSDLEGIASGEANRFEVEFSSNLNVDPVLWSKHPAPVLVRNGSFVFEDTMATGQAARFYRV